MATENTGAYITMATICRDVLRDSEGGLSLIRLINRVTVTGFGGEELPEEFPRVEQQLYIVVTLRPGEERQVHGYELSAVLVTPSGDHLELMKREADLVDKSGGMQFIHRTRFTFAETGRHWVEIHLDGQIKMRLPLDIEYHRQTQATPTGE